MLKRINLVKINGIDNNYTHCIDFASATSRSNYFNSLDKLTYEVNFKDDGLQSKIVLPVSHNLINHMNYLFLSDENNKELYYFITSFEHTTPCNTTLYIQLDVFTTYQFNFNVLPSFVDRCHVPRWNGDIPLINTIDEGIPLNVYEIEGTQDIYKYNDGLLVASTQPLGVCEGFNIGGTGGGSGGGCEGDFKNGILSSNGFRFIKGYEGYAPYKYADSEGYFTICYGVTLHGEPDIYNYLLSMQPVPEQTGAQVSYYLKNERYGKNIISTFTRLHIDTQNKFDACVSLAYNCGYGVLTGTNSLTAALETGNADIIRSTWKEFYINPGTASESGLRARRAAEVSVFLDNNYEMRPIALLNSMGNISGTVTENNGNGWLPECGGGGSNDFENSLGSGWKYPASGQITATYPTYPSGGAHSGIDIANNINTKIYAAKGGNVEIKDNGGVSYGKVIYITHSDGSKAIYGHLNNFNTTTGVTVKQGDHIGYMGTTGNSTGVHLHFEVRNNNGVAIDPIPGLKVGDTI